MMAICALSRPYQLFTSMFCLHFEKSNFFSPKKFASSKNGITFAPQFGALAHLVERNTGSVEVSGSSPLCSTTHNCLIGYKTAN